MKGLVVIILLVAAFGAGYFVGRGPTGDGAGLLEDLQKRIAGAGQAIGQVAGEAQDRLTSGGVAQAQQPAPRERVHAAAVVDRPNSAKRPVSINGRMYMLGTD